MIEFHANDSEASNFRAKMVRKGTRGGKKKNSKSEG